MTEACFLARRDIGGGNWSRVHSQKKRSLSISITPKQIWNVKCRKSRKINLERKMSQIKKHNQPYRGAK